MIGIVKSWTLSVVKSRNMNELPKEKHTNIISEIYQLKIKEKRKLRQETHFECANGPKTGLWRDERISLPIIQVQMRLIHNTQLPRDVLTNS